MAVIDFKNPYGDTLQTDDQLNNDWDSDEFADPFEDFDDGEEFEDDFEQEDQGYTFQDYGPEEPMQDETALRAARKARRKSILHGLLLFAGVIALVAAILIASANREFKTANYHKIVDMVAREGTTYLGLGNNIVSYSRDGASCMDTSGNRIWNVTFEMQSPVAAYNRDILAVGDYGGSTIYVMNDKETLGTIDANLPIRALAVSSSGEVAAVLDDTDVTWVYLFGSDGSTIAYFKTTMNQSGYPLAVAISPNGELVAVSHLTFSNAGIKTSVAFYNFGAVGQNAVENNVSGFNFDDEVFPYVQFMNNGTSVAISDHRIAFFQGSEIPQNGSNAMFSEEVEGVYTSNRYIALLFPDTSGQEDYVLRVYDASGALVGNVPFSMEYTNIQIFGDEIVINNDQNLKIINVNGSLRYDGSFRDTAHAVIPVPAYSNRYTVVTDNTIQEMILE